jgi:hypothetical protein
MRRKNSREQSRARPAPPAKSYRFTARQRLPWLPMFNRDWLGSPVLAGMTAEQEGVLLRLTFHAWETGGVVPADDVLIGTWVKVPVGGPDYDRVVRPVLDRCCRRIKDGYVITEPLQLDTIVQRAEYIRAERQRAGRASAASRAAKHGTAQPIRSNTRSPERRTSVRDDPNTCSDDEIPNTCSTPPEHTGAGAGGGGGAGAGAGADGGQRSSRDSADWVSVEPTDCPTCGRDSCEGCDEFDLPS